MRSFQPALALARSRGGIPDSPRGPPQIAATIMAAPAPPPPKPRAVTLEGSTLGRRRGGIELGQHSHRIRHEGTGKRGGEGRQCGERLAQTIASAAPLLPHHRQWVADRLRTCLPLTQLMAAAVGALPPSGAPLQPRRVEVCMLAMPTVTPHFWLTSTAMRRWRSAKQLCRANYASARR